MRISPDKRLRLEVAVTRACIAITVFACVAFFASYLTGLWGRLADHGDIGEALVYLVLASLLIYGGLVYQCARLGYLRRRAGHRPPKPSELEAAGGEGSPSVAVLVPSYKEEPDVVRRTLLSAALQSYPHRRVVLLIDDPPDPADPRAAEALEAARALPRDVARFLSRPARLCAQALHDLERRVAGGVVDRGDETLRLALLHDRTASWFDEEASAYPAADHSAELFVDGVLRQSASGLRDAAEALRRRAHVPGGSPGEEELLHLYRRLANRFRVEVTTFERKRYRNLSHAANKAMNLNSYIGLLGRRLREVEAEDGLRLEPTGGPEPAGGDGRALVVPDADYVLTLDADSILLPDYTASMVHVMERPENERVAVAQTPYSAFPGARKAIERIAGATTDVQYVIHQGFTRHGATFWVGANALLRRQALEDIVTYERDAGIEVRKYIQDRTVIEDTESSVDLVERGWTLLNYPERLAFSATPPDFGALVIQRRRWANGGLLILPKLLRYLVGRPWRARKLAEGWMRVHYLVSIAAANVALLLILLYPFEDSLATAWLPLTAVPYFALYGRDLVLSGYKATDVVRVYALNLMLVVVNLAGVVKSLHQACTGRQTPFRRTPKVEGRTAAPPLYVLGPYLMLIYLLFGMGFDLASDRVMHAVLSGLNAVLLLYAVCNFIGWRESREDAVTPLRRRLRERTAPSLPRRSRPRALVAEESA